MFDLERADRLSTGLEQLDHGGIDVALLDLSLPDSQGFDTFIKAYSQVPGVPIIVLTVTNDEALATKAVREGAQDYIVKEQLDNNLLGRSILYAIERHRMLAQLEEKGRELQASEVSLRSIIENNADSIVIVDGGGVIRFVNPAAEVLFGRKAGDLVGQSFGFPAQAGKKTEIEIVRNDEEKVVAGMRVVEIGWKGEISYLISLRNITERVRMEEALREKNAQLEDLTKNLRNMAITDGLTRLYNNFYFKEQLSKEIERARRYMQPVSFVMTDIDHFKKYNDTHGHPQGDMVLRRVAEALKSNFRKSDIVSRYGGEEFAIILPQTDKVQALAAAQKVWRAVLEHPFPHGDTQPLGRVTISMGLATFPDESKDETELIAKADARLYIAKREGRNQVVDRP